MKANYILFNRLVGGSENLCDLPDDALAEVSLCGPGGVAQPEEYEDMMARILDEIIRRFQKAAAKREEYEHHGGWDDFEDYDWLYSADSDPYGRDSYDY